MTVESTADDWWIALPSWVLQDGNYSDFAVGDVRQFALEFGYSWSKRLQPVVERKPVSCIHTGRSTLYDVTGDLVRRASGRRMDDAFVLDFGLAAYTSQVVLDDRVHPAEGVQLTGEIGLSVDHFAYFDGLNDLPGMPALIHTWTVLDIQVATGPAIRVEHGDPRYGNSPDEGPRLVLDADRVSWHSVERTRRWDDVGTYRLRCALHPGEPVRTMEVSGDGPPYAALSPS